MENQTLKWGQRSDAGVPCHLTARTLWAGRSFEGPVVFACSHSATLKWISGKNGWMETELGIFLRNLEIPTPLVFIQVSLHKQAVKWTAVSGATIHLSSSSTHLHQLQYCQGTMQDPQCVSQMDKRTNRSFVPLSFFCLQVMLVSPSESFPLHRRRQPFPPLTNSKQMWLKEKESVTK